MASNRVVVARVFQAPVEKVWSAWTDVENLKQWYAPEGMSTPDASLYLHVGGKQMVHMKGSKGEDHINHGEFREIVPMKKLVFSWQWQNEEVVSEVTVDFRKVSDNETEVILTHAFPTEEAVGDHKEGWESIFIRLGKFVES